MESRLVERIAFVVLVAVVAYVVVSFAPRTGRYVPFGERLAVPAILDTRTGEIAYIGAGPVRSFLEESYWRVYNPVSGKARAALAESQSAALEKEKKEKERAAEIEESAREVFAAAQEGGLFELTPVEIKLGLVLGEVTPEEVNDWADHLEKNNPS